MTIEMLKATSFQVEFQKPYIKEKCSFVRFFILQALRM